MRTTLVVFLLAATLLATGPATNGGNANPGIIPNIALPHGTTYGEWGAAWWQWALSSTTADSPVLDTTGEFCGVNQPPEVFFLAGTFGSSEIRECDVPAGQMLFLPLVNAAVWNPEDCPDVQSCQDLATEFMDLVDTLEAEIDGIPVRNLEQYRAQSEPFVLDIAPGSIFTDFGFPAGPRDPTVAEGFYLMLAPLSAGRHEIHFRGGISALGFETEVTYLLRVGSPPGSRNMLAE